MENNRTLVPLADERVWNCEVGIRGLRLVACTGVTGWNGWAAWDEGLMTERDDVYRTGEREREHEIDVLNWTPQSLVAKSFMCASVSRCCPRIAVVSPAAGSNACHPVSVSGDPLSSTLPVRPFTCSSYIPCRIAISPSHPPTDLEPPPPPPTPSPLPLP